MLFCGLQTLLSQVTSLSAFVAVHVGRLAAVQRYMAGLTTPETQECISALQYYIQYVTLVLQHYTLYYTVLHLSITVLHTILHLSTTHSTTHSITVLHTVLHTRGVTIHKSHDSVRTYAIKSRFGMFFGTAVFFVFLLNCIKRDIKYNGG